jgi:hypothetical protein
MARGRAYASLKSFASAGITSYQLIAVLDEVTTDFCRFINGKTFPVGAALQRMADVDSAAEPEAVKELQPWAWTGKNADGEKFLFYKSGGEKKVIAKIDESAVGKKDEIGKFSGSLSNRQLSAAGLSSPPFHGHCRTNMVANFGTATSYPEPPPPPPRGSAPETGNVPPVYDPPKPEPPPPPAKLPSNLAELVRPIPMDGDFETPGDLEPPKPTAEVETDPIELAMQAVAKAPPLYDYSPGWIASPVKKLEDDGSYVPTAHAASVTAALKKPTLAIPIGNLYGVVGEKAGIWRATVESAIQGLPDYVKGKPVVLKSNGSFYIYDGNGKGSLTGKYVNALATAAQFLGKTTFDAHVVDLDELAKKAAKPKKPKVKKPAEAPKATVAAPPPIEIPKPIAPTGRDTDAKTILATKTGDARGSNKGGFYTGSDGVKRYVKFYDEASQAHCENLANGIYRALGHYAPESQTFEDADGKTGYASRIFDGGKTFAELGGPTEAQAKRFLSGFVADVLTGNWDAVGTGADNAMVLANGEVARIDNGGSFLYRARYGRKPAAVLEQITEWDKFFDESVNHDYVKVAKKAGVRGPDDMKDVIRSGVAAMNAFEKREGGWLRVIDKFAPDISFSDKATIASMLHTRAKLLREKVEDWDRPDPTAGALHPEGSDGFSTVLPRAGLRPAELPVHNRLGLLYNQHSLKSGLPDGESNAEYERRANLNIFKASEESKRAIRDFTGTAYSTIRDSEMNGKPEARSIAIQKAFDVVPPEPREVFRGISVPREVVKFYLENETWGLGHGGKGATSSSSWKMSVAFQSGFGGVDREDYQSGTLRKISYSAVSIIFKLKSKTGIAIQTISGVEDEKEILIKASARFRTTGLSWAKTKDKKSDDTILIVEAEEIE